MQYTISGPYEVDHSVARLFEGTQTGTLQLEVLEDRCFAGDFLSVGSIILRPEPDAITQDRPGAYLSAVRGGAFEWKTPAKDVVHAELLKLLDIEKPRSGSRREIVSHQKSVERIARALDSMAHIAVRLGLIHPRFDAGSLEDMPFRRATTIVADTSGIIQGALDFVAKFLHPTTRMKIPAVVHMEIVNQADRFLAMRRSMTALRSPTALLDHLISQGGQRALLRLELQPDTEIERSAMFGDPLRSAFNRDTDDEFRDLNLSVPLRSYCDRLVLETARQHQLYSNPGHSIYILTSDQGLARMALAEGIKPLYFRAVAGADLFGEMLSGVGFHPFTGEPHPVPLTSVLWELATAFGCARLLDTVANRFVEVAAIGEDIVWAPFQSHGDLLGAKVALATSTSRLVAEPDEATSRQSLDRSTTSSKADLVVSGRLLKPGFYKFNVSLMLSVIDQMDKSIKLSQKQITSLLMIKNVEYISEYRKFLESAKLIEISGETWSATEALHNFMIYARNEDYLGLKGALEQAPSFKVFTDALTQRGRFSPDEALPFSKRALPTYQALAEIACIGASIAEEGFFATPNNPIPSEFARTALRRYDELARGEPLVPVGAWLENLIRGDGVHPVVARDRLQEATSMGILNLVTEGSTLDTRHDKHSFRTLEIRQGRPTVQVVHLYRGDFLIPGKASVSLRLQGSVT